MREEHNDHNGCDHIFCHQDPSRTRGEPDTGHGNFDRKGIQVAGTIFHGVNGIQWFLLFLLETSA